MLNHQIACRRCVTVFVLLLVAMVIGVGCSSQKTGGGEAAAGSEPRLAGYAMLPADTFRDGPTSGQWISAMNDRTPPFVKRQPVQGVSAIIADQQGGAGSYLAMSDNGFGKQENSADYVLCVYRVQPDFETGDVSAQTLFELSDPRNLIPFKIVADGASATFTGQTFAVDPVVREKRLLTGADFDLESFRELADGTFVFGDEFGPYLLHTNAKGELIAPPIALPGRWSPQNPVREAGQVPNVATSGGFEGMALSADGLTLYPMLEKPRPDDVAAKGLEIFAFDVATMQYRDVKPLWYYPLDLGSKAIGDFTALDEHRYLVIERDGEQGPASKIKRVYLVDTAGAAAGQVLEKRLVIDLMQVSDAAGRSPHSHGGVYAMPFVTIESVLPVSRDALLIVNDNNYPFSVGRYAGTTEQPDDTEFVVISVPGLGG